MDLLKVFINIARTPCPPAERSPERYHFFFSAKGLWTIRDTESLCFLQRGERKTYRFNGKRITTASFSVPKHFFVRKGLCFPGIISSPTGRRLHWQLLSLQGLGRRFFALSPVSSFSRIISSPGREKNWWRVTDEEGKLLQDFYDPKEVIKNYKGELPPEQSGPSASLNPWRMNPCETSWTRGEGGSPRRHGSLLTLSLLPVIDKESGLGFATTRQRLSLHPELLLALLVIRLDFFSPSPLRNPFFLPLSPPLLTPG